MVASKKTKSNAREYIKIVKNKLQNKRDIYIRFLEVMTAFTAHRIDANSVRSVVKELFKEDLELIPGFNTFLPDGFKITLAVADEQIPPTKCDEYWKALDFVKKVKKTFQDDDRKYKSFVNILDMYRKDLKSIDEVCHEVTILFRNHHDLRVEFYYFLPHY